MSEFRKDAIDEMNAVADALSGGPEIRRLRAKLHVLNLICGTSDANRFDIALDRAIARAEIAEKALDEIHIRAHCLAKAGPLHTPTLQDAWARFMEIGVMATNALAEANAANRVVAPESKKPNSE